MVLLKPGQQQDASGVSYDNTSSGLTAVDLQAAIDETEGRIDTLEGAGTGDDVSVNAAAASDANFNDSTPSAPAGEVNVKWQKDTTNPDNISASVQVTSETQKGVVELATQAEADTGTDDTRAVTPLKLATTPLAGRDTDAIHDNVSGEISVVTEKVTPVNGDFVLIEDSADSNNKKRAQLGNLPGGGGSAGEQGAVQARRTTGYTTTASFADITLDATDVENDITVAEHDNTNTDRITLKETGLYRITYHGICSEPSGSASNLNIESRVRVDDTTVIDGSEDRTTVFDDSSIEGNFHDDAISGSFLYEATANEQVTLQIQHVDLGASGDTSSVTGIIFTAVRLSGEKGDTGAQGPAGAGSAESDMQEASESVETSITSTSFVDLDSITLTTSNTASKDYAIAFNGAFRGGNNQTITIQLVVDGVVQAKTIRPGATTGTTKPINLGTIGKGSSLATGKVIKVQWKVSGATAFADERCITIHGVS